MCHVPGASAWHLNFQVQGALCKVTWKVGKGGIPEKGSQNAVQKCLFQVASALQSKVNEIPQVVLGEGDDGLYVHVFPYTEEGGWDFEACKV